ncbi:D-alanyl-D-alanine carboxypeptidase [Streptomyces sp. PBH53]|uniref:D-alanyl-D-alanine carboxypeptidase n=1 Tax=Streptomyces sp. PBH53 TaxID=1577075 RepID=UPI0021C4565E|nr:D-alanyl-D-alanine carboxypeptidase [Streptomyces sp. PBH53]
MEEASVAGESPDRSKQRESSAEPTSGSAGSVPEARDPRLAVSREKDSSGGGPDTATKVLTVRPETPTTPKQPAGTDEDTALRAAVSTWVRDSTPDAPANVADEAASEAPSETEEASGAEAKAKAKAKAKAEKSSGAEAEPERASDATADAEAEAEASSGTSAEDEAEAEAEAKALSGTEAEAEAASEEPTDADANAKDTADTDAADEASAAAKSETDADTKPAAGAKGSTGATVEADAKSEADGEEGPEAADGGDTPQGPPAADDETRTGGAGGNTDAEGEAEAKAPADAPQANAPADAPQATGVDQATTVFKAVRPKKPAVDQPTTMLKLGGKPNPPESDSERTSKFVALKDDLRKPPAPQPKPAAQPKATPQPKPAAQPAPDATTPVPQVGPERTTQQPLPPKPPLDLLAELTNTPPPPETPVRTLVRRIKIWTPLVLLLVIVFAVVQAFRPLPSPTLTLTGEDTYTFDGGRTNLPWPGEGQGWMDVDGVGTMGHFGKQTPVAIGSVAKTMTAYIILKEHPLKPGEEGPKIKVDATAEKEGGYNKAGESTLDTVKAGDHLTEKQALSAVMIPSANNIARLLARWDAGSEEAFVKKMNATARELGMTDTTYTDPSGLKETTVSTAEDQVKLGRAFVKVPALVAISSAASWTDPSGRFWPNYNELPFKIGAIGIKTGSTTAAGGNLLFASRKEVGGRTVTLVGAILGQHKREILATVNAVSKTALLAAQDALTSKKILKKGDVVGYVDDRLGGHTPIVVTKDVTAAGWAGLKVKLSFASGTVPHTAKAGTRVGTLTVGDGTPAAVKVPVALEKDLAEPGFGAKLTRLG